MASIKTDACYEHGTAFPEGDRCYLCARYEACERPMDAPSRNFDKDQRNCIKCGANILYSGEVCPTCGFSENQSDPVDDGKKYVQPWPGAEPELWKDPVTGETKADLDAIVERDEYYILRQIMIDAFNFASKGKGDERHGAPGLRWEDQRHAAIAKELGTGFALGQAVKKAYESQRLDADAAERELLGAMTYMASAIYAIRQGWRK